MVPIFNIRTQFNYRPRPLGSVFDEVLVDVVDTSVDNVKNNISTSSSAPASSYYTNSDVPVSLFGPGITATHYDPNRHRGVFAAKDSSAPAAAAAAAPSSAVSSNAASNAAVGSVASSNSSSVS